MKARIVSQVRQAKYDLLSQIPVPSPFIIYIEPSGVCNLRCKFCPQAVEDKTIKKSVMSFDTWVKAIDDIATFPRRLKVLRVCGNGETLVNRDIVPMLIYAKSIDITERIELVTNGTLLTDHLATELPRYADRIVVSVYDLDNQRLLENVRKLYEHRRKCILHVKTTTDVAKDAEQFYKQYGDWCDEIFIEHLVPMWPQFDGVVGPDESRYGGALVKRRICSQIFKGMQVQADGEVVPCCVDWRRVNVIGNINTESLMDIWNGEKLKRLREEHLAGNKANVEPCRDCQMNDYCDVDNIDGYRG